MGVFALTKFKLPVKQGKKPWRLVITSLLLVLVTAIAACGDKEPAQRKAFIDFLQAQIITAQGTNLPALTQDQKTAFGKYIKDYAVMRDFHQKMETELNSSLVPVFSSMNALTSVNALLQQRDELQKMADKSPRWLEETKLLQVQTDAQREGLKQPEDLKKTYDQAYNKVVSQPSAAAEQIFTLLPEVLKNIVVKADFIKSQGKTVTISGNTLQFANQAQLDKYNAIQKKLLPLNAQLMALSRELHRAAE
jgi:hypothetical protein